MNAYWVARTTQTNRPAGFDAQSTQHPGAAEMPAEISEALSSLRDERKKMRKTERMKQNYKLSF